MSSIIVIHCPFSFSCIDVDKVIGDTSLEVFIESTRAKDSLSYEEIRFQILDRQV